MCTLLITQGAGHPRRIRYESGAVGAGGGHHGRCHAPDMTPPKVTFRHMGYQEPEFFYLEMAIRLSPGHLPYPPCHEDRWQSSSEILKTTGTSLTETTCAQDP